VPSERCVVSFQIQFKIFVQAMLTQKADNGCAIEVVLMFGRLHWFWLDEESTFKALATSVVACHGQEARHVLLLTLHVGVEQAHVTFTAAPEYVVFAIKRDGCIERVLQLRTSVGNDFEI